MNFDNCPICKKDWSLSTTSRFCKTCDLFYDFSDKKRYILINTYYSENEFEKMLKFKTFW